MPNLKQMFRPIQRNKVFVSSATGGSVAIGGLLGAVAGYDSSFNHDKDGKRTTKKSGANSKRRTLIGAALGGTLMGAAGFIRSGSMAARSDAESRFFRNNQRRWRNYGRKSGEDFFSRFRGFNPPPPPPRPQRASASDIAGFFKQHGNVDHTTIKTKTQAKKVFRDAARKHHPDMGGNEEVFKKLNADWERVQSSDFFEKLASFKGLIKLALEIPISHLKDDAKEINEIRGLAQKIVKLTRNMNKEDKEAMK